MDTVRLANASDAQGVAQIQISNWQFAHPAVAQTLDLAEVESAWAQAVINQNDIGRVLVCERDGKLIGTAAIEFNGHVGVLSLLEVAHEVRRQLVGARLLNAVADIARQAGCQQLSLWLSTGELAGQQFFKSLGWAPSGATRVVSTINDALDSHLNPPQTEQQLELVTSLEGP